MEDQIYVLPEKVWRMKEDLALITYEYTNFLIPKSPLGTRSTQLRQVEIQSPNFVTEDNRRKWKIWWLYIFT